MERPVMNPTFAAPEHDVPAPRRNWLHFLTAPYRLVLWILLFDLVPSRGEVCVRQPRTLGRLIRTAANGIVFVPLLIPAVIAALVYIGTHPPRWTTSLDPASRGIYYDRVAVTTDDEVGIEAWFIPVVDENAILKQKENALQARRPAVLLVHDEDANRSQMLPLIQPLREKGFVVMVIGLRTNDPNTGTTFGLRESNDVRAAMETLRRHPGVNPRRVGIVGVGTGANAALIAADSDPQLAAIVVEKPVQDADEFITNRLGPSQPWMKWISPFCKWGFEMAYRVDADDLGVSRHQQALEKRPSLVFGESMGVTQTAKSESIGRICIFLEKYLGDPAQASTDPR